jgi:hypothetical protein
MPARSMSTRLGWGIVRADRDGAGDTETDTEGIASPSVEGSGEGDARVESGRAASCGPRGWGIPTCQTSTEELDRLNGRREGVDGRDVTWRGATVSVLECEPEAVAEVDGKAMLLRRLACSPPPPLSSSLADVSSDTSDSRSTTASLDPPLAWIARRTFAGDDSSSTSRGERLIRCLSRSDGARDEFEVALSSEMTMLELGSTAED